MSTSTILFLILGVVIKLHNDTAEINFIKSSDYKALYRIHEDKDETTTQSVQKKFIFTRIDPPVPSKRCGGRLLQIHNAHSIDALYQEYKQFYF